MFGIFRNRTWGIIISAKNGTLEFALGIAEEISLNVTGAGSANALEIPEVYKLIPAVGSTLKQPTIFTLIAGATQNLSPFI